MDELVVEKAEFTKSLENIERISKENENLKGLKTFDEKGGLFNLFPTIISGKNMNEFTAQLQDQLIILNEKINKSFSQFVEVYNAFDKLDKEYISGIVGAFNQAIEATKKAEDAQKDIAKTVEALKAMVQKLTDFNKTVSDEFITSDGEHLNQVVSKHEIELKEAAKTLDSLASAIVSYKSQYNSLFLELEEYKKEKKKHRLSLVICWTFSGVLSLVVVALILLLVFGIL